MRWQELKQEWHKDPKRREAFEREFPYHKIADELVALRASRGLTQSELAKKMKTTQSVVARLESGRHAVTLRTVDRVAVCFGVSWRILFESVETAAVASIANVTMAAPSSVSPRIPTVPVRPRSAGKNSYALAA